MAAGLSTRHRETPAHTRLKRLTMIWAQARGYSACALEVYLPQCRFRADVAAFREHRDGDCAAIFECKQALSDLRRDNCDPLVTRKWLQVWEERREVIERNLRVHYPTLRTGDSLFPDFDAFDFSRLDHRGHTQVTRESAVLRQRLIDCTKFAKLTRYQCANLFYLVIAPPLRNIASELPPRWGVLVERADTLELVQKPMWHEVGTETKMRFLRRVAAAATRALNRELAITSDMLEVARRETI